MVGVVSRRDALKIGAAAGATAILAACSPQRPIPPIEVRPTPTYRPEEELIEIPKPQGILKVKIDKFTESPNPTIIIPAENMTDVREMYKWFGAAMDTKSYRGIIKQQWNEFLHKTETSGGKIAWIIDRDPKKAKIIIDFDFEVLSINFSSSSVDLLVEYNKDDQGKIIPAILMIPYEDFSREMLGTTGIKGSEILFEMVSTLAEGRKNSSFHSSGIIVHPDFRGRLMNQPEFNSEGVSMKEVFRKMWEGLATEMEMEVESEEFIAYLNKYLETNNMTPGFTRKLEDQDYQFIDTKKMFDGEMFTELHRIRYKGHFLVTGTAVNIYRFAIGPDYESELVNGVYKMRVYALVEPIGVEENVSNRAAFKDKTLEMTGYMQGGKKVWVPIEYLAAPSRNFIEPY